MKKIYCNSVENILNGKTSEKLLVLSERSGRCLLSLPFFNIVLEIGALEIRRVQ